MGQAGEFAAKRASGQNAGAPIWRAGVLPGARFFILGKELPCTIEH